MPMPFPTDQLPGYVRQLISRTCEEPVADAVLLARFRTVGDPEAFAALVRRHGPMVLRVCRRLLGSVHDAEDAFQATFLVLVRRAAVVQPGRPLAAWLYGVAHRVGLEARSADLRRRRREGSPAVFDAPDPGPDPLARLSAREVLVAVEEEVRALPERYRLPLVLCCLDGHSQEEASACWAGRPARSRAVWSAAGPVCTSAWCKGA
jgi:RNA polymerase sigma factor (sigma-70 family)